MPYDTTQVTTMTLATSDARFDWLCFPDRRSTGRILAAEYGSSGHCAWPSDLTEQLADRVDQLCRFARWAYEEIDAEKLYRAQNEANVLIHSSVFSEALSPEVCIDPHGEISFTHKSRSGYVDIGVRGDGELSYHVRNDLEPEQSVHDDHVWQDCIVPMKLRESLQVLTG